MLIAQLLREYLEAEHLDKKKTPIDLSEWEDYQHEVRPNSLAFAKASGRSATAERLRLRCLHLASHGVSLSSRRGARLWPGACGSSVGELTSRQENMSYLRKKLVLEIAQNEFIDESY